MSDRKLNILIADDEPSVAASLSIVLCAAGHRVESVSDGQQALERVTQDLGQFDLLVIDNTMAPLKGSELVQELRTWNFPGRIVILSGHLTPELERIYHTLGVDGIVHKPYDLSTIRTIVEQVAAAPPAAPPLRSLAILVADDEPAIAQSLSVVLKAAGHTIEAAADGMEAFNTIAKNPRKFDLLITDNTMPGLSGCELVKKLRETEFGGKIMVLSGRLTPRLEDAYRQLSVHAIVHKPYYLSTIRGIIERIVFGTEPAAEQPATAR